MERDHVEGLSVEKKIILKWIFIKWGGHGLDSFGLKIGTGGWSL